MDKRETSLVLTFKSGKVSILTVSDSEAVKNLIAVFENSDANQTKPIKMVTVRNEVYYIRPSEIAI